VVGHRACEQLLTVGFVTERAEQPNQYGAYDKYDTCTCNEGAQIHRSVCEHDQREGIGVGAVL
jgi:hypothetical protein